MKKLIALVACMIGVIACTPPSSSSYLSGNHQVYYVVTVATGTFTANTLSVSLQTSPQGTTPATINSLPIPYTSSTYSMNFSGSGAHLSASAAATVATGPGSLTMSIWIDGVQKYTAATVIAAASGANATVAVQSPVI